MIQDDKPAPKHYKGRVMMTDDEQESDGERKEMKRKEKRLVSLERVILILGSKDVPDVRRKL